MNALIVSLEDLMDVLGIETVDALKADVARMGGRMKWVACQIVSARQSGVCLDTARVNRELKAILGE